MPVFIRVILFLLLGWLVMAQLFYLALPLFGYYLFRYSSYELIVLAILFDGYYFAFYDVPKLTILVLLLVVLVNFIKPRLLMYTKDDATLS